MTGKDFSTEKEVWKAIPDFEGYEVSDRGRVRSFLYQKGQRTVIMSEPQKILKPNILRNGYHQVTLRKNNKPQCFKVHKLVLIVFQTPRPFGLQACHNDGDTSNNHIVNLRWDTCKNNHADRRAHGTDPVGERSNSAKLTEIKVKEIRNLFCAGYRNKDLAKMYGVEKSTITSLVNRKTWVHVL